MRDRILAIFFALFTLGWLVFDLPTAFGIVDETTGWYAREVDPLFRHPPLWLQVVSVMAACYGPVYAALAYGLWRRRPWVHTLVLPFAGVITGTNLVYLSVEMLGDEPPLRPGIFLALNLPYLIVPILTAGAHARPDRTTR